MKKEKILTNYAIKFKDSNKNSEKGNFRPPILSKIKIFSNINQKSDFKKFIEIFRKRIVSYDTDKDCYLIAKNGRTSRRHHYDLVNDHTLKCSECGKVLKNRNWSETLAKKSIKHMIKLDEWKNPGDRTVYIILWQLNGLTFCYVGQTCKKIKNRLNSHIYSTFKKYQINLNSLSEWEEYIINNFGTIQKALDVLIIIPLQIVKFQGNWSELSNTKDPINYESMIKKIHKETDKVTGNIKEFFIGLFKAQFRECGLNTRKGGELGDKDLIAFNKLENAINKVKNSNKPLKDILEMLSTDTLILKLSLEYWYGTKDLREFIVKRKTEELVSLFEKGYYIYLFDKNNFKQSRKLSHSEINHLLEKHYREIYLKRGSLIEVQEIVLKEKIRNLIINGYLTCKDLLTEIPGFKTLHNLKNFIINEMGTTNEFKLLDENFKANIEKKRVDYLYLKSIFLIKNFKKYSDPRELIKGLGGLGYADHEYITDPKKVIETKVGVSYDFLYWLTKKALVDLTRRDLF